MQRLVLILLLAITPTLAACPKKGPTTPAGPKVTEAPLAKESLVTFMNERFPQAITDGILILEWGSDDMDKEVVTELGMMGVKTTTQLNAIIPPDYQTKGMNAVKASSDPTTNITGLMRDIMIIHDAKKYVGEVWRNSWSASGPEDFPAPIAYGVDMKILEEGGVFGGGDGEGEDYDEGMGEEDEGDPCEGGDPCAD